MPFRGDTMLVINKMRANHVIDHAAEELKKYLRMMMPECGEIDILSKSNATDGFRLGLLEDFGLPSEAEDPVLDDVIPMAKGEHKEAALAREDFYGTFGKYELEIERYYDHGLASRVLQHITRKTKGIILD